MSLLLVSEQDEEGAVAWVWHWRPGFRVARPLNDLSEVSQDLDQAEFFGASREDTVAWIERQFSSELH